MTRSVVRWVSAWIASRSEEHTSELQSQSNLVCRLLLEKKKQHLVLVHADLDRVAGVCDSRKLLKRAAWDNRLELRRAASELGLLDRQPVRIGCGHHDLA